MKKNVKQIIALVMLSMAVVLAFVLSKNSSSNEQLQQIQVGYAPSLIMPKDNEQVLANEVLQIAFAHPEIIEPGLSGLVVNDESIDYEPEEWKIYFGASLVEVLSIEGYNNKSIELLKFGNLKERSVGEPRRVNFCGIEAEQYTMNENEFYGRITIAKGPERTILVLKWPEERSIYNLDNNSVYDRVIESTTCSL